MFTKPSENYHKLKEYLKNKSDGLKILIVVHVDPDFDAVGSALACAMQFEKHGIENIIWIPEGITKDYAFLPEFDLIQKKYPTDFDYNTLLVLDSSSLERVKDYEKLKTHVEIINIDHHKDNNYFGSINIYEKISSVGEILMNLFSVLDWELDIKIATCLYAAIIYDTGQFRHTNVSTHTFINAAKLVDTGISHTFITQKIFENKTLDNFKQIEEAIANLKINRKYKIVWTILKNCSKLVGHDIIDFIRTLKDIDIYMVFRKMEKNKVKVSIRSNSDFDVSEFAAIFGGGGHKRAAGISFNEDLEVVEKKVIKKLEDEFAARK